jgi:hypothetical protein
MEKRPRKTFTNPSGWDFLTLYIKIVFLRIYFLIYVKEIKFKKIKPVQKFNLNFFTEQYL